VSYALQLLLLLAVVDIRGVGVGDTWDQPAALLPFLQQYQLASIRDVLPPD
jgi:hypothetical protein